MGKHDEYEYKMLLTKEEYDNIRTWAETNYISLMRSFVQVNYYYDTPDFRFQKVGTTIRVRQAGDTLRVRSKSIWREETYFIAKRKRFPLPICQGESHTKMKLPFYKGSW